VFVKVVFKVTFLVLLADLQEGELIHGDNFNLFAAMSALEVFLLFGLNCILKKTGLYA